MTTLRNAWRNLRGPESSSGRRSFYAAGFLGLVVLGGCGFERQSNGESPAADSAQGGPASEVEAMLLASAVSWNGGDLDGFMDDYWPSEELTFSGGTGVTRGWDNVRTRYLETYWAPDAARDSLRFEEIEVMELGEEHALALGRYVLFQPGEEEIVIATGHFSLVLQRVEGRWEILHDHTSATPEADAPESGGS